MVVHIVFSPLAIVKYTLSLYIGYCPEDRVVPDFTQATMNKHTRRRTDQVAVDFTLYFSVSGVLVHKPFR